ncbi:MAG TPA: hypothetical protein VGF59_04045 [Bryobacteraceae bacterium]
MLRVSHTDDDGGQRWTLCGYLAGPWVEELRGSWAQARRRAPLSRAIVDLTDVTFIDDAGERLLGEMERAGAEFVAAGVENKHVIASLKTEANRSLRRRLEDLCAPCGERAKPKEGNQ